MKRWGGRRSSIVRGEINWKRLYKDKHIKDKQSKDPKSLRPLWIPDADVSQCRNCQATFNVIKRRVLFFTFYFYIFFIFLYYFFKIFFYIFFLIFL